VKIWLFALLQSLIAAAGLAAWFYADNIVLAGIAVGAAAVLGVVQPLLSARKQQKQEAWREDQHVKTLKVIDSHVDDALEDVIPPPFPHRPTVAAFLELAGLGDSMEQLQRYDDLIEEIRNADEGCPHQAAAFCAELTGNVLGVALEGLAALAVGNLEEARRFFEEATQLNSSWAMPWLGWATVCYQQGDYETLAAQHPHINGVELLCYDCGDEEVFMELAESERESLTELYQQTATALGNYYAAAEMAKSRQSYEETHEELRKAA
jgi:tetratricopeptide (TPR) repeat protein